MIKAGTNPLYVDRKGKNIFDYLDEQNSSARLISKQIISFSYKAAVLSFSIKNVF